MPAAKRRSSANSRPRRTSSGRARLPPPTMMGARKSRHSSTSSALNAWSASPGPPVVRSLLADALISRTALGSKPRSIRVLRVGASCNVLEDDLVGRLPDLGEVLGELRGGGKGRIGFPGQHRLVHPAPVQVGPNGTLQGVDEPVDLFVRLGPVKLAVLVLDVSIQGDDRGVDELGHARRSVRITPARNNRKVGDPTGSRLARTRRSSADYGASGTRTRALGVANAALSQLSYGPVGSIVGARPATSWVVV